MGGTCEKLRAAGVETLAIVEDATEPMRLYYRFHPVRVPLASDPARTVYRSFRLPMPAYTPELIEARRAARINPTAELPESMSVGDAQDTLNRMDGTLDRDESREVMRQWDKRDFLFFGAHYLLDRHGIVRWASIECAQEGVTDWGRFPLAPGEMGGWGTFPTDDELLAAVRALQ